jgi:hypothetical protein
MCIVNDKSPKIIQKTEQQRQFEGNAQIIPSSIK